MKLKRVSALLASTALLTLVVACQTKESTQAGATPAASGSAQPSGPINIDYWGGWTGPDLETMKGLVGKFNAEQKKIHVEFTSMQWTPLFTKFLTEMKGGQPPDVLAMHPFEIGQFAEMGVLDAKALESAKLTKADYSDFAWGGTMYKGKQYAVPLDVHMHGLFFNKEMLEKAGVAAAPKTGDELIAFAQKLTLDKNGKHPNESGFDDNNITQYGLGFNMNHHAFYQFYALLSQQGENPFKEDMKKLDFDEQKAAKAFGFLEDLIFKYKVVPKGEKSPVDDFISGKVAMIVDGPWQMPKLETSSVKWGSAPYPKVFDKQVAWGAAEVLTFPVNEKANASEKAAAVEFVKWLDKNSGEWANSGQLPSSNSGMEVAKKMPGREAFVSSLSNAVLLPAHPKSAQLFSSTAPSPILTAAQDAVLNNKNPLEIVKQLKKDINAILAE
ncbi:ABC transporter substrate-binding protein [Paenibacillus alba]|uniref:ABC transporter substrate-binding protein n=1 Tax=Paenibacillus alba TaxID=1197127 RepID=A0ABU6GA13_9BACL|nr:ABC transporter substrate-binding protein [Paenibacillus alba]MEC0231037.1 ABC transporter substrate-binding protein [Paenibacillus alba]NQX69843.1 ABC transporter substrate-binding protein [Paenibacillus alba]